MKKVIQHYETFHGTDPEYVTEKRCWVPGGLVLIGAGLDVGYGIIETDSKKDGKYVHEFGKGVKCYRRARQNEQPDKVYKNFPKDLMVLGDSLGFTYEDDRGEHEVKGSTRQKLCVTPNKRMLVVVGPNGVMYVMQGGQMRVTDWIRD